MSSLASCEAANTYTLLAGGSTRQTKRRLPRMRPVSLCEAESKRHRVRGLHRLIEARGNHTPWGMLTSMPGSFRGNRKAESPQCVAARRTWLPSQRHPSEGAVVKGGTHKVRVALLSRQACVVLISVCRYVSAHVVADLLMGQLISASRRSAVATRFLPSANTTQLFKI